MNRFTKRLFLVLGLSALVLGGTGYALRHELRSALIHQRIQFSDKHTLVIDDMHYTATGDERFVHMNCRWLGPSPFPHLDTNFRKRNFYAGISPLPDTGTFVLHVPVTHHPHFLETIDVPFYIVRSPSCDGVIHTRFWPR